MRRFFESLVGRRWLAWTVLALAIVVIVLSSLTVWVKRQALDTDNWVDVSGQLLENEQVRQVVASDLTDALFTNTDVQAQLQRALPPRFDALAVPATGLLRQAAYTSALELLSRPAVQQLWKEANRRAHRSLIAVLDGKPTGVLSADRESVVLDLRPLVAALAARIGLTVTLPPTAGLVTVLRSDQLGPAQDAVKLVRTLSVYLVILAFALLALAIYLARGFRWQMLRATAIAFVGIGIVLLVLRKIAGDQVIASITSPTTEGAGTTVWLIATGLLHDVAIALIVYGIVLLVGVLLAGPSRWATALRRRLAPAMRDHLVIVYAVVAALFLLFLAYGPGGGDRRLLASIVLAVLAVGGVEVLRRQILRESPPAAG